MTKSGIHSDMFTHPEEGEVEQWSCVPKDLEGRVVSLSELKQLFPNKRLIDKLSVIEKTDRAKFYGGKRKPAPDEREYMIKLHAQEYKTKKGYVIPVYLAYKCKSCSTLIVGPPIIKGDTSMNSSFPLTGRIGYDVYCKVCKKGIKTHTFMIS